MTPPQTHPSFTEQAIAEMAARLWTRIGQSLVMHWHPALPDQKREGEGATWHHGFSRHRWVTNELERKYADAWEREAPRTLPWVLKNSSDDNDAGDVSIRDSQVAASIIQWLGSPVGREFIRSVIGECHVR